MNPLTIDPSEEEIQNPCWCVAVGTNAQALGYGAVAIGDNSCTKDVFGVDSTETVTIPDYACTRESYDAIAGHLCRRELLPDYPTKQEQLAQLRRVLIMIDERMDK